MSEAAPADEGLWGRGTREEDRLLKGKAEGSLAISLRIGSELPSSRGGGIVMVDRPEQSRGTG